MLVTEEKPLAEVLDRMAGQDAIFIVGCQGCPMGWETGGPEKVAALARSAPRSKARASRWSARA